MTREHREPVSLHDTRQPDAIQRDLDARMAAARRAAAKRNPGKAAQHFLSAALLDPAVPDYFGRETLQPAADARRRISAIQRQEKDRGIKR